MPIIPVPPPNLRNVAITPGDPSFANGLQLYADLYELDAGIVRAATTNIIDFEIFYDVDASGTLQVTFLPGDTGLLHAPGDSNGTLPFSDTLLASTNPTGTPSDIITTFGTNFRNTQLRFSLGGGDFVDARKLVIKNSRSADIAKPEIIEEGFTYWDNFGKITIPHRTANNVAFQDYMFAEMGEITAFNPGYSNAKTSPPPGSTGNFLLQLPPGTNLNNLPPPPSQLQPSGNSGGTAIPAYGYLGFNVGGYGRLPFIGGMFKQYQPVDMSNPNNNSFLYIPIISQDLYNIPINIDVFADTIDKMLQATMKRLGGYTNTPYVAHYCEDSSELYNSLLPGQYQSSGTNIGANAIILGQIFQSSLRFFSADYEQTTFQESPLGQEGTRVFDPAVHARIEKGALMEPDFSSVYSEAYMIGGSTNCDFPQSGNITSMVMYNTKYTGDPKWNCNVPLVGVSVTAVVGGIYAHIGDQHFIQVFGYPVHDIYYDATHNIIFAATEAGVFVCVNLQIGKTNTWTRLGNFVAPIQKLQIMFSTDSLNFGAFNDPAGEAGSELDPLPDGCKVWGLANGGLGSTNGAAGTQSGVFSYPMALPASPSGLPGATNAQVASGIDQHGGWDGILQSDSAGNGNNVDTFAVLDDIAIFWSDASNSPGSIMGKSFSPNSDAIYYYPLEAGDAVSQVIGVNEYPLGTNSNTSTTTSSLFVLTNGIEGKIYIKNSGVTNNDFHKLSINISSSDTNKSIPLSFNNLKVLPYGTYINGNFVTAILCTDQGLYITSDQFPNFINWRGINQQSGLDSQNLAFVDVGKPYSDTRTFISGYTLPVQYSPMICGDSNSYLESYSGGVWWTDRLKDKVSLAWYWFNAYYDTNNKTYAPLTPAYQEIQLTKIDSGDNITGYPQGPYAADPKDFYWCRDRNDLGEFYYYLKIKNRPFLKTGQSAMPVSSLSTSTLIDVRLCSTQLAAVAKRWLYENSSPPMLLTIESSFSDRFAGLRFLRPMHIVKVDYTQVIYTEDGQPHTFMKFVDQDFYALTHRMKFGGSSQNLCVTTTELTTEMQKQRLTPDELAADVQQIIRDIQIYHN